MGIPFDRSRTYVPGVSEVDAGDLNDMQDSHSQGAHGLQTKWFRVVAHDGKGTTQGGMADTGGGIRFATIGVDLPEGATITAVNVLVTDSAAESIDAQLWRFSKDGSLPSFVSSLKVSTKSGAAQNLALDSMPYPVPVGSTCHILCRTADLNHLVDGADVTFHLPLKPV